MGAPCYLGWVLVFCSLAVRPQLGFARESETECANYLDWTRVQALVRNNSFVTDRGLSEYQHELGFDFLASLRGAPPGTRWLDAGAGRAVAQRELLKMNEIEAFELVGFGVRKPWWVPRRLTTGAGGQFIYYDHIDIDDAGAGARLAAFDGYFDVITDVFGPMSYSTNPAKVLNLYLRWLRPGGTIRIGMRDFGAETVTDEKGRTTPLGKWLRSAMASMQGVEFQEKNGSWKIRKELAAAELPGDLSMTAVFAGNPPTRKFRQKSAWHRFGGAERNNSAEDPDVGERPVPPR